MNGFKYLGYANGWEETPEEVTDCHGKEHKLNYISEPYCVTVYLCEKCKYYYRIDSGD